jgi:hypothetical protein
MTRRLEFRPAARLDALRLINSLIVSGAAGAAGRLARLLQAETEAIRNSPFAAPAGPNENWRQRVFRFGRSRYVIRYRVTADAIIVTRIWHGKQDRPGSG